MQTSEGKIPVIIGITGHRRIRRDALPDIRRAVKEEIRRVTELCPHAPVLLMSNMAEGADLLCMDVAREMGLGYVAALPMEAGFYRADFSSEAELFESLLRGAGQCFSVTGEAEPGNRDDCYLRAGKYLVDHCHVLFSLWDGMPGKRGGCGAAEITEYALCCGRPVVHILTPRQDADGGKAGAVYRLGQNPEEDVVSTERFDRMVESQTDEPHAGLFPGESGDSVLSAIDAVYCRADGESSRLAAKYKRELFALAVLGSLFALFFLLYDEANAHGLIFACGGVLLIALVILKTAERRGWQRGYTEYRVLAESLRVQGYLRYAGSEVQGRSLLPWSRQHDTGWIPAALGALTVGPRPEVRRDVGEAWLADQKRYHERNAVKRQNQADRGERVLKIATGLSLLAYGAALMLELHGARYLSPERAENVRTAVKICTGMFSAATLFFADYSGKLSVERQAEDSRRMAAFYERMLLLSAKTEEPEDEFLAGIAREELIENSNWYAYTVDNAPDIDI